jgi:hypothetical protein
VPTDVALAWIDAAAGLAVLFAGWVWSAIMSRANLMSFRAVVIRGKRLGPPFGAPIVMVGAVTW